ncbi:MAG: HAMP domain-containing protein [Verrucomicrobiaceae bacterium]|nr:HAMP domain-containing protein [Verrucomicrobiaceae bacterium]
MKTIRGKLLITLGLVLAAALTSASVLTYGFFRSRLDDDLDSHLKTIAFAASRIADLRHAQVQTYLEQGLDLKPGGAFVVLFDRDGKLIDHSTGFTEALTLSDAVRQSSPGRSEAMLEEVRTPSGRVFRIATFARVDYLDGERSLQFFAQAGMPLDRHQLKLRQLTIWLAISGSGLWLIAMFIAWLLMNRWLHSLTTLSHAAKQMTESKQTRQRLHVDPRDAEIASLSQSINQLLDHLDSAYSTQQRFVADASHELRTPLTILRGEIEVALRKPRSADEYREVLQSNKEEIEALSRLTDNLLTLARADAGQIALHREDIDLVELVRDVSVRLQPAAEKRGVGIEIEAEGDTQLSCDRLQIERVVFNLIDNAVSFSPAGESVSVVIGGVEGAIRLEVRDSGPGIQADHLPHLFDRFYRADQSRSREHEGAGLGLAIVKAFVEADGGSVEVYSEFGRGSAFVVRFPRR